MFADLFEHSGRRSVPPCVVATVMVLQRLEGLSDRDAVERYGVETEGQLAALIGVECDLGQGYLFAKPLEQAELATLVTLEAQLLRVLLGSAGHEMTEVTDPVGFMAALREVQPDLVLMDLRLKGTSGFELVEEADTLLTMPVVAVTGYPDWVVDHDARSRHFTSVVSKPVEPGALLARLDGLLAGRPRRPAKIPA